MPYAPHRSPISLYLKATLVFVGHMKKLLSNAFMLQSLFLGKQSSTWQTNEFYWGYVQEYGRGVTYGSRNDSKNSHITKAHNNSLKSETWGALYNLQITQPADCFPFLLTQFA